MGKRIISEELHAEYSAKLEQLLDDQDEVREKRSEISQALGGELKIIAKDLARTRRILKGAENPQTEIAGTETGPRKRDPAVIEILRAAAGFNLGRGKGKVAEKKGRQDPAEQPERDDGLISWTRERAGTWKGKGAEGRKYLVTRNEIGWHEERPGISVGCGGSGPYDTVEAAKAAAERRERGRQPLGSTKPPPVGELEWHREGVNQVAHVAAGVYCVEPGVRPGDEYRVYWTEHGGRSKRIGMAQLLEQAKEIAERHHLERLANEQLPPELVQPSLSGPAVKKRRRR